MVRPRSWNTETLSNVNVNTTETVVNATCTNPTAGSITLNTTGGIPPYTYSINGGALQSSNVFTGLTQGAKTITIKDAFCGTYKNGDSRIYR